MTAPDEFSDPRRNLAEELRARTGDSADGADAADEGGCCPPPDPFIPVAGGGTFTGDTNGDGDVHAFGSCDHAYIKSIDLGFMLHSGSDITLTFEGRVSQSDPGTGKSFTCYVMACGEDAAELALLTFINGNALGDGDPILGYGVITMSGDTTGGADGNGAAETNKVYTLGRDTSSISLAMVPSDCAQPWYTNGEAFITVVSFTDPSPEETDALGPEHGQWVAPEESVGDDTDTRTTNYPYIEGSLVVYANGVWVHPAETDPDTGVFTLPFAYSSAVTLDWTYQAQDDEVLNTNALATSIDFWDLVSGGGSALEVLDEAGSLDTAVTSIDFTGSGVTATAIGHAITVDIPAGGTAAAEDVTFDPTGLDNTAATDVQAALVDFDSAISAATGGGGGLSIPAMIQVVYNGVSVNSLTIAAAASGHTLVFFANSTTGQLTSPTCTNVTFTQIKTLTSGGGSFYCVWIGKVSGGSSGTTLSWTNAGSFTSAIVVEISDTLAGTPTLGANATLTTSSSFPATNLIHVTGATPGNLVAFAVGQDNTGNNERIYPSVPSVGWGDGQAVGLYVGYAANADVTMVANCSGVGGAILAEFS